VQTHDLLCKQGFLCKAWVINQMMIRAYGWPAQTSVPIAKNRVSNKDTTGTERGTGRFCVDAPGSGHSLLIGS
jgi:hypothetical protein